MSASVGLGIVPFQSWGSVLRVPEPPNRPRSNALLNTAPKPSEHSSRHCSVAGSSLNQITAIGEEGMCDVWTFKRTISSITGHRDVFPFFLEHLRRVRVLFVLSDWPVSVLLSFFIERGCSVSRTPHPKKESQRSSVNFRVTRSVSTVESRVQSDKSGFWVAPAGPAASLSRAER